MWVYKIDINFLLHEIFVYDLGDGYIYTPLVVVQCFKTSVYDNIVSLTLGVQYVYLVKVGAKAFPSVALLLARPSLPLNIRLFIIKVS